MDRFRHVLRLIAQWPLYDKWTTFLKVQNNFHCSLSTLWQGVQFLQQSETKAISRDAWRRLLVREKSERELLVETYQQRIGRRLSSDFQTTIYRPTGSSRFVFVCINIFIIVWFISIRRFVSFVCAQRGRFVSVVVRSVCDLCARRRREMKQTIDCITFDCDSSAAFIQCSTRNGWCQV